MITAAAGMPIPLATAGEHSPVVVVVDDLLNSRLLLSHLVRQVDPAIEVIAFGDADDALDFAIDHRVDLLLTDYYLPAFNGVELVKRFRALAQHAEVPVVMVTVEHDRKLCYEALDVGANDFLLKPLDEQETMARCRNLLQLRRHQLVIADRALLLADQVRQAVAEVHDRELETLTALARAAEQRDRGTGTHLQRMARLSGLIARTIGLDEDSATQIEVVAPMHDIGKLGVLDSILHKAGKLTEAETALMRKHTRIGYEILRAGNSRYLQMAAVIALSHHERYDGKGYPDGLAGESIPLPARIVAVADVFDALISPRPYKGGWPQEQVFEHLRAERGKHFDPRCVDALLSHGNALTVLLADLTD